MVQQSIGAESLSKDAGWWVRTLLLGLGVLGTFIALKHHHHEVVPDIIYANGELHSLEYLLGEDLFPDPR